MKSIRLFSAVLLLSSISLQLHARPYASGLTNSGAAISFRLNESADSVKIISAGGTVTNDLGALDAGPHTFPLTITGPYEVEVFKVSEPGFIAPIAPNRGAVLQIGTDTNTTRFNQPRGLAVNTDPASPYFGRIYVANGAAAAATFPRAVGDGIYVLNPDMTDALGQGDTPLTGGLDFSASTVTPYRLSLGQDGNLYIADWSDPTGTLYVTDPNVSAGSGQNVLGGPAGGPFPVTDTRIHGSIAAAVVEGSLLNGDLTAYVIDEDLQNDRASTAPNMRNSLWRHDIGAALPGPEVMPTLLRDGNSEWYDNVSQTMDLDRGTNGYFYVFSNRSVGSDRSGVTVLGPDGNDLLFTSLQASRAFTGNPSENDLLRTTGGGAVSPHGDYLALINFETNGITVVPLIDGVPDLTNRLVFHGMGSAAAQGRDVAFDLAGNIYAISSGAGLLRAFSPGGTSTAITGSDGTFRLVLPTSVSVLAEDTDGYEQGADPISFKVIREGSTAQPLTVNLTWSGTATNGVDYVTAPATVVIPAGQTEVVVPITPIDDSEAEVTETVILTLGISAEYNLGSPAAGTATISDNEAPIVLRIRPLDANAYERFPGDTIGFTITRLGDTNSSQFVRFNFLGSATLDVDYTRNWGDQDLLIPEGVVSTNIFVSPIDDRQFEGDETVTIGLTPNDYEVEAPGTASGTIREDDYPPERTIFADDFNVDSSANWGLMFWAANDIPDYTVDWAFDYSVLGIPPAPRSEDLDTHGVRIAVNKNEGTARGAAAVNLYPANHTFSGDYALRFDMYLQYGGTAGQTEHALVGINHSGTVTNRMNQSDTTPARDSTHGADGIWVAIETDGSANREWSVYTSTNAAAQPALITNRTAASVASLVPSPPYSAAGAPGNLTSSSTKTWAAMEMSQVGNVISLRVNGNTIYRFTNTFGFNSGTIMIGHNDQFDSIGTPPTANFVIFDNVRVVRLGLELFDITVAGNTVQLDFDAFDGGTASEFRIESTSTLSPPAWTEETGATISATPSGFRATVPASGAMRFYRVRR